MTSEVDWGVLQPLIDNRDTNDRILGCLARVAKPLPSSAISQYLEIPSETIKSALRPQRNLRKNNLVNPASTGYTLTPKGRQAFHSLAEELLLNQLESAHLDDLRIKRTETVAELLNVSQRFLSTYYNDQILAAVAHNKPSVSIDFRTLSQASPDLADKLFEMPEEVLAALNESVRDIVGENIEGIRIVVRILNLPETDKMQISALRSNHIGKLMAVVGDVTVQSNPQPAVTNARFKCPSCGNVIPVLQLDAEKFLEPSRCSCGRKGKFKLLSKDLIDVQTLQIQEPLELSDRLESRGLLILLRGDLCSVEMERLTEIGKRIRVNGVLKELPEKLRTGEQSIKYGLLLEANSIESIDDAYSELTFSDEEVKAYEKFASNNDVIAKISGDAYSHIEGWGDVKASAILQQVGGCSEDSREQIHILLAGDPQTAKTDVLIATQKISPKYRSVNCENLSQVGLTGSVYKDELTGKWIPHAGPLSQANEGTLFIDELDKCPNKDQLNALHEPMQSGTVTITKAKLHFRLRCKTSILAACNPRHSKFVNDEHNKPYQQINLKNSLWSRFDLVWCITDDPSPTVDRRIAARILSRFTGVLNKRRVDYDFYRKFLAYAKQKIKPTLTIEQQQYIAELYAKNRQRFKDKEIPYGARQCNAIARISGAYARLRLSNTISFHDIKAAKSLIEKSLTSMTLEHYDTLDSFDPVGSEWSKGSIESRGHEVIK